MIAAFELLKEKMLSRTTVFAKRTSLGISLVEKLNSPFFSHKHYFDLKLLEGPRGIEYFQGKNHKDSLTLEILNN